MKRASWNVDKGQQYFLQQILYRFLSKKNNTCTLAYQNIPFLISKLKIKKQRSSNIQHSKPTKNIFDWNFFRRSKWS